MSNCNNNNNSPAAAVDLKVTKPLVETPTNATPSQGLSLFDQLKNSADHNNVTKTALNKQSKIEKTDPKSGDITAVSKPEFHAPPPPSATSSVSNSNATNKRLQSVVNASPKFPLKPPNKDLTATLRSLKRSQPPPPPPPLPLPPPPSPSAILATQKTVSSSATAAVANASASLSSPAVNAAAVRHTSGSTSAADAAAVAHTTSSINHNAKKKRCTDRYDSSESSDR
uniref:Uncharacterized protein n=1 Tax=Stomoxys calcitrans TaxID=35570 RepID=A0A1I8PHY8_STOCA